jgi:hypothetical protein
MSAMEDRWLAGQLARLRSLDNALRGGFAEVVVAELLPGATICDDPWGPWDVEWDGITIQVKCSGARQAWHGPDDPPSRTTWSVAPTGYRERPLDPDVLARWADVWVLARHDGYDLHAGWSFYVVTREALDRHDGRSISPVVAARLGVWVKDPDDLAAGIQKALFLEGQKAAMTSVT